jgi:hypothetical protein
MKLDNGDANWYTFNIPVAAILEYLEHQTGIPYTAALQNGPEANKWHMALREGLQNHLHLNLGIPGIEDPEQPIEENESSLLAALLLGKPVLPVILSGEWELAVEAGLITREQLLIHEEASNQTLVP